jgi:hypothetical protein
LVLHRAGWRPLLAVSWALYICYRIQPHQVTMAGFEYVFPTLTWQLLFVHGIAIGYHREDLGRFMARAPGFVPAAAALATAAFAAFALCNPWSAGPAWLQLNLVSPDRFAHMYTHYFALTELGIGRLMNLAIALPLGYALLTRYWTLARALPLQSLFVTLGQRSLGAFVLHVYGLVLLAHLRLPAGVLISTAAQIALVVAIAIPLGITHRLRSKSRKPAPVHAQPLAA